MAKTSPAKAQTGRFAYEGLDRVIHEKARLGVLTSLIAHPKGLIFADLKRLCGLTDGNLSRHLQVLQEAGLVDIVKGYEQNRPQTICRSPRAAAGASSTISPCSNRSCAMRRMPRRMQRRSPAIRRRRVRDSSVFFWLETLRCKVLSTVDRRLHVAIIMDGNGRWATARGLPRTAGHRAGVEAVRRVVEAAPKTRRRPRSRCSRSRPTTGGARRQR